MSELESIQLDVWVARAQLGEAPAFEQLLRLFHAKVRYYVRKMLFDEELAEDVMQEVWLTVHRKLHQLRATEAFSVWLYRIAHSEAIRAIRVESRYVQMDDPQLTMLSDSVPDEEPEYSDEEVALLNRALELIPHLQREAIILRFMGELSYVQIAQVTGSNLGTIRSPPAPRQKVSENCHGGPASCRANLIWPKS